MLGDKQPGHFDPLPWSLEGLGIDEPSTPEQEAPVEPLRRKPVLAVISNAISDEHAKLLEWFFGEGRATFGRSTCGALIERLKLFAFGSDPCKACKGTGFRGGWSYGEELARVKTPAEELAELIAVQRQASADDADGVCEKCLGTAVTPRSAQRPRRKPITARPKPTKSEGAGYTPTDYALQHYAIACRRIDVVNRTDRRAASVLEAFHGDWGGRWADTKQGRIFAVGAFTPAGHKLLKMSGAKTKQEREELPPHEILGVEFELQRTQPNNQRRDLLAAMREQSQRLLEQSYRVWNVSEPRQEIEARERREATKKVKRDLRIREILAGGMP